MKSPSESIGTPYTRHDSPIPQSSGAPKLPIVFAHVHVERQPGLSLFERHSKETTRMIRKKRMSRSAR